MKIPGEFGQENYLASRRVEPGKLLAAGYRNSMLPNFYRDRKMAT